MAASKFLCSTVLSGLALAAPAFAQQVPATVPPVQADRTSQKETDQSTPPEGADAPDDDSSDIIVTGSLIPQSQLETTAAAVAVSSEQITARGFTNLLDAINDIPLVGGGASPFGTNGGQPGSLGSSNPDVLDLGTQRTLTLLNGRRVISDTAASLFVAGNATGSQVNANALPSGLTESVNILAASGAVVYGADAVAGVIDVRLKTDFEGFRLTGLSGITQRGDGGYSQLTALGGTNFAGGRGNVTASFEYARDDALTGASRPNIARSFVAPTSFRNGAVRNTGFAPSLSVTSLAGGAFLPQASDGVPNNIAGRGFSGGTIQYSNSGNIFQVLATVPTGLNQGMFTSNPNTSAGFRPTVPQSLAGNVNLVPGIPIAATGGAGCSITDLSNFCTFAPSGLPGTRPTIATGATPTAAQATALAQRDAFVNAVITRFAPQLAGQGTAEQRDNLALELLKVNRPTPREFLAANPGVNVNAFIGTLIPAFLDVQNTGAGASALPRLAVPLRFDRSGNVVPFTAAVIDPLVTPSTTGGAVGGDNFFNNPDLTVLRVQSDRYIGNFFAQFEVTPGITLFTENLYAREKTVAPANFASRNSIDVNSSENAVLIMDIANPFLNAGSVSALRAAGVTGKFLLSRTNQDIVGNNPSSVDVETIRTVVGARGGFDLFGRNQVYDVSGSYGRARRIGSSFQIRDIEYALALDAVRDANGNIVCRAQVSPGAFLGQTPFGVVGQELVRVRGADGVLQEQFLRRTVTAEQIQACRPLNVFGEGNMSQESLNYVLARTGFRSANEMYFGRAQLGGGLFALPGGDLRYGLVGEYRRETVNYRPDDVSAIGGTRTAALAATRGAINALEFGGEIAIPILGQDFTLPLTRSLAITPGVRALRQSGSAPSFRRLDGTLAEQRQPENWNTVWAVAGEWSTTFGLSLTGNITRSVRQPSVSELFLGGQPSFTAPGDPCGVNSIGQGTRPEVRRANCRAAVVAAGLAANTAAADVFLNSYLPSGGSITGTFSGVPTLQPERGRSWTVGAGFNPSFIPRLSVKVDYFDVQIRDQIATLGVATALQICYDSPNFPDTSGQVGVNVCDFFQRLPAGDQRQFELANGFTSGFANLGAQRLKALNTIFRYDIGLDGLFGPDAGRFSIYGNAYHTFSFLFAPDGDFATALQSAGTLARPKWRTQLRGRYDNGGFYGQWVWNWQNRTRLFSSGAPVEGTNEVNEVQDYIRFPSFSTHSATVGFGFGEEQRFGIQLTVQNVLDKQEIGPVAQARAFGVINDNFGRRFVLSANLSF